MFSHAQELIRTEPENPANKINKIIPNYDAYVAKCPGGRRPTLNGLVVVGRPTVSA